MHVAKRSGRPPATTVNQNLEIALCAIEDKSITRQEIKHNLDINVSLTTITKRLNEAKLYCRVARKKAFLSAGHKARRLQFSFNYRDFNEWDRTIFVDESSFQSGRSYKALIRRPIGTAFHEEYIQKTTYSGRISVPVFGLMTRNSLGPLVRIEGNFNSLKYLEILNREVLDYAEAEFGYGDWYYYQDNSPIHKSQIVNEWFQQNLTPYQRIPAPPNSPDFNPIEHAWSQAKVRVSNGGIYDSADDLWLGISEAWIDMQENNEYLTHNLVNSMPQRLQSAIDVFGSYTKY